MIESVKITGDNITTSASVEYIPRSQIGYACKICGRFIPITVGTQHPIICSECARRLKELLYKEDNDELV